MMQDTIEAHDCFLYLMNRVMDRECQIIRYFAWILPYGENNG